MTGNKNTGTNTSYRGGVYMTNNSDKLTVSGATIIDDNMIAADSSAPQEVNVLLQSNGASVNVDCLRDGAKLSILTYAGGVDTPTFLKDVTDPVTWKKTWVTYENNGMAVDYDKQKDEFFFASTSTHVHCACGDHLWDEETCAHAANPGCDHSELTYEPWNSTNSLPKDSGNFYLTGDVVLAGETAVSLNDTINLCLNGYTVTVDHATEGKINDQIFYITRNASLTISDCTAHTDAEGNYVAGKLTGGSRSVITLGDTGTYKPEATVTIHDGIIAGNKASAHSGAIQMQTGTSTLNIHGGLLTDNTGSAGGAVYVGKGNTFTMTGGQISGNTASVSGGGVYIHDEAAAVNISGSAVIADNLCGTVKNNLYLNGDVQITVGQMEQDANVNITADIAQDPRQISTGAAALTGLSSDSQYRPLQQIEGIVYMTFAKDHVHCDCGGSDVGCDHSQIAWVAWENTTSLPTGDLIKGNKAGAAGGMVVSGEEYHCTITAHVGSGDDFIVKDFTFVNGTAN